VGDDLEHPADRVSVRPRLVDPGDHRGLGLGIRAAQGRGIRLLAWQVSRLADDAHARLYVGNIVRMQEEIGTGGGGFRFLYASFLQELAQLTGYRALDPLAARLVEIGDRWREFALAAARMIRGRDPLVEGDCALVPDAWIERVKRRMGCRELRRSHHELSSLRT
jgi:hypothetical protein